MLPITVILPYHGYVSIRIALEKMVCSHKGQMMITKNADMYCKWETNSKDFSLFLTMQSAFQSVSIN